MTCARITNTFAVLHCICVQDIECTISSWDVLLMNYRFSLLPPCFTMLPVYRHQIFSALWLDLMHRSPPAAFRRLTGQRKLGFTKKKLLSKWKTCCPFIRFYLSEMWALRKLACFCNVSIRTHADSLRTSRFHQDV